MATVVLSAAGAAIGGSIGGTVLGVSMAALGRLAGAAAGRLIDQRLMGAGADAVETGRIDRFRLTGAGEGDVIPRIYGRTRVGGQVIWASGFTEHSQTSGGGKGTAGPRTTEFSYTVSLAVAICEGEIGGIGRIWADGIEIAPKGLNMRVYRGGHDQLPDPKIDAVEGAGSVPAYRGTAYVVFEDLELSQFGNRIPQFNFEVLAPEFKKMDPAAMIKGVAMMPGTGEYALATVPVKFDYGLGKTDPRNVNTPSDQPDWTTSLELLESELPQNKAISLIVSWFGNDLRCGECQLRPKVEQKEHDGSDMAWKVAGLSRDAAQLVAMDGDNRPVYGGTPTDQSVVQSIQDMNARGQAVMFYPFILMEQMAGNGLPDPWTGAKEQPPLPWRGRITASIAPTQVGSPNGTATVNAEVAQFFGTACASDFSIHDGYVSYTGPSEWGYRRFILHYAALCMAAGGVDSFCIGSEMRSLTQLQGSEGRFVAVEALIDLLKEVRILMGPDVKLGYAADWSEYFGYQPQDGSGDRYFHLDPLWANGDTDFIGIDNYMPLSDWRDGEDHADAEAGSIYDLDYLRSNIEGGEGYDWYYHSIDARNAQIRTPITDGAHNEPWIYRNKDIRNWWLNTHFERINGVRQQTPTAWAPQSKPIWFTELGCAAIDKGANQPNKFLDPKSSESALPRYSNGRRDELMQMQYLKAMYGYWTDPQNNPVSPVYDAPMLDMSRAFVWAWDARPYPFFPGNDDLWTDAPNYMRGHWISGRMAAQSLAAVVSDICDRAGLIHYDVSRLYGVVRGYVINHSHDARAALQPLMLRYGFDAVERDGTLVFKMRNGIADFTIGTDDLCTSSDLPYGISETRLAEGEQLGRLRLRFAQADASYEVISEEAALPDETIHIVSGSELAMTMTRSEGRQTVERWLSETRVTQDIVQLALPPSQTDIGAGDVISYNGAHYRVDRVEHGTTQLLEAVRTDPEIYRPLDFTDEAGTLARYVPPSAVFPMLMDLPLVQGDDAPVAPHLAVTGDPWTGSVATYSATQDADYQLNTITPTRATIGRLLSPLPSASSALVDRANTVQVRLATGALQSVDPPAVLNGANLAVIGDGTPDHWEIIQFEQADLVDKDTYLLRNLVRGLRGTDALMPDTWPVGSYFVVLNRAVEQIKMIDTLRDVEQHFRIGPAQRGYDDNSYVHRIHAFAGHGLRPLSPVHLTAQSDGTDCHISWIRRGRIDSDSWAGIDIPVGEESERYVLRLWAGLEVVREEVLSEPFVSIPMATISNLGATEASVTQVSARYGEGAMSQHLVLP